VEGILEGANDEDPSFLEEDGSIAQEYNITGCDEDEDLGEGEKMKEACRTVESRMGMRHETDA
jgi:hypothetical protein